ncbi:hypothetical protein L1887_18660 [Cichorium endivia]|nr:hypothetical protein L1887_18660 [Cichorium endivia]
MPTTPHKGDSPLCLVLASSLHYSTPHSSAPLRSLLIVQSTGCCTKNIKVSHLEPENPQAGNKEHLDRNPASNSRFWIEFLPGSGTVAPLLYPSLAPLCPCFAVQSTGCPRSSPSSLVSRRNCPRSSPSSFVQSMVEP